MQPVLFTYTEGSDRERFAVHLDGAISRPAINWGPSGKWRFEGISTGQGRRVLGWPGMVDALANAGKVDLAGGRHVLDFDHGTFRMHGAPLQTVYLAQGLPSDWHAMAGELWADRLIAEAEKLEAEGRARLVNAKRGGRVVADVEGIQVRRKGNEFYVIEGDAATDGLSFAEAAEALGAALIERHS